MHTNISCDSSEEVVMHDAFSFRTLMQIKLEINVSLLLVYILLTRFRIHPEVAIDGAKRLDVFLSPF
jgi:hypothetical protein